MYKVVTINIKYLIYSLVLASSLKTQPVKSNFEMERSKKKKKTDQDVAIKTFLYNKI